MIISISSNTATDVQYVYQPNIVIFSVLISRVLEGRDVEVAVNATSISSEFNVHYC